MNIFFLSFSSPGPWQQAGERIEEEGRMGYKSKKEVK